MTDLRVSQTKRLSIVNTDSPLRVSQIKRMSIVNPDIPLRVSQIKRMTIIQPQSEVLYCWARQTDFPQIYAVTPVRIST